MKKLKLLLFLFYSLIPFYTSANIDTSSNDNDLLTELNEKLANKTFAEITQELHTKLQQLESLSPTDLLGTLSMRSMDVQTPKYTKPLVFPDAKTIQSTFNAYLDATQFQQTIYGNQSKINLSLSPFNLVNHLEAYKNYRFEPPSFSITQVYVKDGSSSNMMDKNSKLINNNKQIIALELTAQYSIPKNPIDKLIFSNSFAKIQHEISLTAIEKNSAIFTLPQSLIDSIFKIEGVDKQGNVLESSGYYSVTFNPDKINRIKQFIQPLVKQIDDKKITDKNAIMAYIAEHASILKHNNHEQQYAMISYQFYGEVDSINLYLQPVPSTIYYTTKLNQTKSSYINGLTIAKNQDGTKQGIINEQGEWIIPPDYANIYHQIDNYYRISTHDKTALYLLDTNHNQLQQQPFFIINKNIYPQQLVTISQSDTNQAIKGLLDIKTHKIILPIKYDYIQVTENFYITDQYDQKQNKHYREVYNINNHHKIYTGNADIIVDKAIFITKELICQTEQSKNDAHQSAQSSCYKQYDLYDSNGNKLNDKEYRDVIGHFSQSNLLLVLDNNQQPLFINRQAQKLNIDLSHYKSVGPFSQGLAAVECNKNEQYGYIDEEGKLVIPCIYKQANYFQGGSAMVEYYGGYQLIRPDNSIVKVFDEKALIAYSNSQDLDSAEYTFNQTVIYDASKFNADDIRIYNNKGELIPDHK